MSMDIELAHKTAGKTRFEKWLALLVGLAAVAAAVLGTLEVDSNKLQEQAQARSSRLAVEIFGRLAGSASAQDAGLMAQQAAALRDLQATGRRIETETRPATADFETALADADHNAATQLAALAQAVSDLPGPQSGVDPVTRSVVATTTDQVTALVKQQNHLIDVANRFGNRGSRGVFAITILALAAVLLGLSAVLGADGHGSVTLVLAGLALIASAGLGASALRI
jgi:hypothetical protein